MIDKHALDSQLQVSTTPSRFAQDIGDGVAHTVDVVHPLGRDVLTRVYDQAGFSRTVSVTHFPDRLRVTNGYLDLASGQMVTQPIPKGWRIVLVG